MSPEAAEELPHVADQEIGDFHSGEVPAPVELRPVLDLVVGVHHRRTNGWAAKSAHPCGASPGAPHSVECAVSYRNRAAEAPVPVYQ